MQVVTVPGIAIIGTVIAAAALVVPSSGAKEYSIRVKGACAAGYQSFCSQYELAI